MHFPTLLSLSFLAFTSIHALPGKEARAPELVARDTEPMAKSLEAFTGLIARDTEAEAEAEALIESTGDSILIARQTDPESLARALALILTATAPQDLIGTISAALNMQLFTLLVGNESIGQVSQLIASTLGQGGKFAESLGVVLAALRGGGEGCEE